MRNVGSIRGRLAVVLAALLLGAPASAAVISTSGAISFISAPASTLEGALESNSEIFLFAEQSITLSTALTVDVDQTGTYSNANVPPGGGASVAAGTAVDSYFVHYDVLSNNQINTGSITFDTDILGVMLYETSLASSDAVVGNLGTLYTPSDANRGADFGPDIVDLNLALRTITITFRENANRLDQIRILVAKAPEPGTGLLLGAGLLALGLARRRHR